MTVASGRDGARALRLLMAGLGVNIADLDIRALIRGQQSLAAGGDGQIRREEK